MAIYTRTGDLGKTSLFGGVRVWKSSAQTEAYGSLDELTSFLGILVIKAPQEKKQITQIQNDLYLIMALFAGYPKASFGLKGRIRKFEKIIDSYEKRLPKLTRFLLPQGTETSVLFHFARALCRRAERRMVAYLSRTKNKTPQQQKLSIAYINRLSDLLFIYARVYNSSEKTI